MIKPCLTIDQRWPSSTVKCQPSWNHDSNHGPSSTGKASSASPPYRSRSCAWPTRCSEGQLRVSRDYPGRNIAKAERDPGMDQHRVTGALVDGKILERRVFNQEFKTGVPSSLRCSPWFSHSWKFLPKFAKLQTTFSLCVLLFRTFQCSNSFSKIVVPCISPGKLTKV